jgi:hypothetical protein
MRIGWARCPAPGLGHHVTLEPSPHDPGDFRFRMRSLVRSAREEATGGFCRLSDSPLILGPLRACLGDNSSAEAHCRGQEDGTAPGSRPCPASATGSTGSAASPTCIAGALSGTIRASYTASAETAAPRLRIGRLLHRSDRSRRADPVPGRGDRSARGDRDKASCRTAVPVRAGPHGIGERQSSAGTSGHDG